MRLRRLASSCFFLLCVHIVGADLLPLEEDLEGAREERGPGRRRIIFVAEVVPLAPLINEDAQVWRVGVELEQQLV